MSHLLFDEYVRQRCGALGIPIAPEQLQRLRGYYELLRKWNETTNLTSHDLASSDERALERLIVEPLASAVHVAESVVSWLDIGSGGGSPAIPLKVMLSDHIQLTMTESRFKKAAFLREATRTLGLQNVAVYCGRFEELSDPPGRFDLITSRAVRLDDVATRALHGCLKPGGLLLSFGHESSHQLAGFRWLSSENRLSIFTRV